MSHTKKGILSPARTWFKARLDLAKAIGTKQPLHISTVDPESEWKTGLGWFLRFQGIGLTICIKLLLSGAAWKAVGLWPGITVLAVGSGIVGCLVLTRRFVQGSVVADEKLHNFVHSSRDDVLHILNMDGRKVGAQNAVASFHKQSV